MTAPAVNVKKPARQPASSGHYSQTAVLGSNRTPPAPGGQHHPNSHPARILAALRAGQTMTAASAWRDFGCMRLAAVVCVLRRDGWDIETTTIAVRTARGRLAHVAEYRIGGAP